MFLKNKSFNVKVVDDSGPQNVYIPRKPIDYDKINELVNEKILYIGLAVAGVVVAKNVSWTLSMAASNAIRQIVDVKFPYPPVKY